MSAPLLEVSGSGSDGRWRVGTDLGDHGVVSREVVYDVDGLVSIISMAASVVVQNGKLGLGCRISLQR